MPCPKDIAPCTGPTCKAACEKQGTFGCVAAGCGDIWRLDLADASWHAIDSLPVNTSYVGAAATLGTNLYLLTTGNGMGGSLPQYALDLQTGNKTALGPPLLSPIVAAFGDKLAMGDWPAGLDVWKPGDATMQPFVPSPPCPALASGGGLVSFQTPEPTLVWTTGWRADLTNCPTGTTLDVSKPLKFRTWLSTGGSWTPGPTMPMNVADGNLILAVGWSGGVFYIPRFKPTGGGALQPTWLLASPGDHFEEFPPPPTEHPTTMAVVVIQ